MNTSTLIFKSKATALSLVFGLFLVLLSFISMSSVKAQDISELNQFLESQESNELGIDRDYLFDKISTVHVSRNRIKVSDDGRPLKIDVRMNAINRINEISDDLRSVENFQVKISNDADKSGIIPSGISELMPSLKVIFILSEIPISDAEVQRMVSSMQNSAVKILYLYSQPV